MRKNSRDPLLAVDHQLHNFRVDRKLTFPAGNEMGLQREYAKLNRIIEY